MAIWVDPDAPMMPAPAPPQPAPSSTPVKP
jgi:hypothetical protein